jgi:hypothetical protein
MRATETGCSVSAVRTVAILGLIFLSVACGFAAARHPPSSVVFTGNFETGDVAQWTRGAQCANTSSAPMLFTRGTITVQSEGVAQGRYAARIDLPAAPRDSTACETLAKRKIGVGSDDYYGLMVRFPPVWREPSPGAWGLAIAQLNYQNIWGSPVMLVAHADRVAMVLQSGLCRPGGSPHPGCAYSSGLGGNVKRMVAVRAPMALGPGTSWSCASAGPQTLRA